MQAPQKKPIKKFAAREVNDTVGSNDDKLLQVDRQNIDRREVESEGDAVSISKDFFKLQDQLNKSIRSKATQFCMSEKGDCLRLCQHEMEQHHCHNCDAMQLL